MKTTAWILISLMVFTAAAFAADIEMKSVKSSLIDKIGYDPAAKTLVVQMNNSSDTYTYEGVSQAVYDDFLAADSKGAYFVEHIKGKFSHDKDE